MKTVKCFTFLKQHCFFAFIVPHMQKKQKKAKSSHSVSLLALLIKPPSCLVQFFMSVDRLLKEAVMLLVICLTWKQFHLKTGGKSN